MSLLSRVIQLWLAGVVGICATTVSAVEYNFESPVRLKAAGEVIDTGKYVAHSGPAFADLNDDGLVDLLVGNFQGHIEFFENKGSKKSPEYAAGKMLEADGETIEVNNW